MSAYSTETSFASPVANDTAVHLKGSATVRAQLFEMLFSSSATPSENNTQFALVRTTSAGTTPGATLTVSKFDPFSPTAGVSAEGNGYATEPTFTETLQTFDVHQKATYRWVAYPGREIKSTATAANGLGIVVLGQSAAHALDVDCAWLE